MKLDAPIATSVVFENEDVRVWEQTVPAGSEIPRHEHRNDYYLINVRGKGPIAVTFHDGSGGKLGDQIVYEPVPGRADFVPKGHIETAVNQGEEYRAILVELKN
ncbi:MAG: hypothetical protein ACPHAN_03235 [Pseudomonadales bacterium]